MIAEQHATKISVIVTTYQRPHNLRYVLDSIARQAKPTNLFDVVVSDDGSTDETPQVVEQFAAQSGLPVAFVTHRHDGFQVAKCRNQGAQRARGNYLVFLDGDCVAGPGFLDLFASQARSEEVLAGDVYCLTKEQTDRFFAAPTEETLQQQQPMDSEVKRVRRRHSKFARAELWRRFWRPRNLIKPALKSGVFGIWKSDFYRVNGFDQNYVGWGCEDDDLGARLRMAGVAIRSVIPQLQVFHLWHPRGETVPDKWKEGANADYFQRRGRLARCVNGIESRSLEDLQLVIKGRPQGSSLAFEYLSRLASQERAPEVEVVFWPGPGSFDRRGDCRLLVATGDQPIPRRLRQLADRIVTDQTVTTAAGQWRFTLDELEEALKSIT